MLSHSFINNAVIKNELSTNLQMNLGIYGDFQGFNGENLDRDASDRSADHDKTCFNTKNIFQMMCFGIMEEKNCLITNELKLSIKKGLLYLNLTKIKKWIGKIIFKNPSQNKLNKYIEKGIETIGSFTKNLRARISEQHEEIIMQECFISNSLWDLTKNNKTEIKNFDSLKHQVCNKNSGIFSIYLKNILNDKNLLFNLSTFISMKCVQDCPDFIKVLSNFQSILRSICASRGGVIFLLSSKEDMSWMIKSLQNICREMESGFSAKKLKKLLKIENFNYFLKVGDYQSLKQISSWILINRPNNESWITNKASFEKHCIAKQILLFLQILVKVGNLLNDIFHSIFSQDSDLNL
jgi:hypothetical protein